MAVDTNHDDFSSEVDRRDGSGRGFPATHVYRDGPAEHDQQRRE